MSISLIPETAPFDADQRAWLNGFFAGLLGVEEANRNGKPAANSGAGSAVAALMPPQNGEMQETEEEDFPWHDPALPLAERLQLAEDKPVERRLMAAMAQLDCGACGYLCKTYSEAIASGEERSLTLCSPGGKDTAKMVKTILKEGGGKNGSPKRNGHTIPTLEPETSKAQEHDRKNPYPATLVSTANLNREGSSKETRHVVIDLSGSGLTYEPGDSLGVYPTNCPQLVEQVIEAIHADGEQRVSGHDGHERTLRESLLATCNVRDFDEDLALLLAETANGPDADRLKALAEDDDRMSAMDLLDLLDAAPSARPDVESFLSGLSPLAPRLYSIASSLRACPDEVHLTVAKATTMVAGRLRKGVASTMFAERMSAGDRVPVFVQPSHGFRLPADPNTPIIMVGPGTGVAPFRSFLQERKAGGAQGDAWLFFGDQHRESDFLYQTELSEYLASGTLTRLDTAFSRDQEQKVYVQHQMREQGAELYRWLESGAHFYVCGDAKRMAGDVDRALHEIIAQHGGKSLDESKAYVAELSRGKRYLRDVY